MTFLHPPSLLSHSIYLRCLRASPAVCAHSHRRCNAPALFPSLRSYIRLFCSLFCCFFCQSSLLIYASWHIWTRRTTRSIGRLPPRGRGSLPTHVRLPGADYGYLGATPAVYFFVWMCMCMCHTDRWRACYQEEAKRNRGNSIGLLEADFRRGDADSKPHSGRRCSESTCVFSHNRHIRLFSRS